MKSFATILTQPCTVFKVRKAADDLAATMPGEAFVIERHDGKFVVEIRDEDGQFVGVL